MHQKRWYYGSFPRKRSGPFLFNRDIKTIGKHITNALKEELKDLATVANFATVQKEGVRSVSRMIEHYNLDMILSIGYRVKSANGIRFRRWANQVLKDYMLKGYAVNQRKIATDLQIADLVKSAKRSVVFIDPFATIEVLKFAALRAKGGDFKPLEFEEVLIISPGFLRYGRCGRFRCVLRSCPWSGERG